MNYLELYQEDFRSKAVWQDICDALEVSSDTGYIVLRVDRTEVMEDKANET
ncbi:MAG: hypothetical protein ABGY11_04100 [Candidatus Thioglobus sp.]|jgi:hypothetical protein